MKISLLVIRCNDIEISKEFYEGLGLKFKKEKHGSGPIHYSCESDGCVFELYPNTDQGVSDRTRLGFQVVGIDKVVDNVKVETTYEYNGVSIYVVSDPDGRKVEISTKHT